MSVDPLKIRRLFADAWIAASKQKYSEAQGLSEHALSYAEEAVAVRHPALPSILKLLIDAYELLQPYQELDRVNERILQLIKGGAFR